MHVTRGCIDISETRMSLRSVDAAMAHPRVEVDVWGHGWDGWQEGLSLSANLHNRVLPGTEMPVGCGY